MFTFVFTQAASSSLPRVSQDAQHAPGAFAAFLDERCINWYIERTR